MNEWEKGTMTIIDGRVRLRTKTLIDFWKTEKNSGLKNYIEMYHMQDRLSIMDVADLIALASESGIEKLLVYGSTPTENTHILELSKKNPALIPVGGISLDAGIRVALEEIISLKDQNIAAIDISFLCDRNVNDRELYALYAYCEINALPVIIHSGIHYSRDVNMWKAQPQ
ncbi:MAG: hypothetical protein U9N86_07940, partial [Bacteroidota bacterium]|nr:hypothetical protein [Bacteroidota bacterium]